METRPFYKRFLQSFGIAKAKTREESKPVTATVNLSEPVEPTRNVHRGTKATKGAFGKCRYVFDTTKVTDLRFNHSLRRHGGYQ